MLVGTLVATTTMMMMMMMMMLILMMTIMMTLVNDSGLEDYHGLRQQRRRPRHE